MVVRPLRWLLGMTAVVVVCLLMIQYMQPAEPESLPPTPDTVMRSNGWTGHINLTYDQNASCASNSLMIWCAGDLAGSILYTTFSQDNGYTWTWSRFVIDFFDSYRNFDVAIDPLNGTAYIVYEHHFSNGTVAIELDAWYGPSFSLSSKFILNDANVVPHLPTIASDFIGVSNNPVYVAWENITDANNTTVDFAYSNDAGVTWCQDAGNCSSNLTSNEYRAVAGNGSDNWSHTEPDIITDGAGDVFIAYQASNNSSSHSQIDVLRSSDGGENFTLTSNVSNAAGDNSSRHPSIFTVHGNGGEMGIAYEYDDGTNWDAHVVNSTDGGASWESTSDVLSATASDETWPTCAFDGTGTGSTVLNGNVHCGWVQDSEMYYSNASYNAMGDWTAPRVVSNGTGIGMDRPTFMTTYEQGGLWYPYMGYQTTEGMVKGITMGGLTINSSSGDGFLVDGLHYENNTTFAWPVGTQHSVSAMPPTVVGPGDRIAFSSWSNGGASSQVVTVGVTPDLEVIYTHQYELTTDNGGFGIVTPGGWHDEGVQVQVQISGSPFNLGDDRYIFEQWSNCSTSTQTTITVTMTGPMGCNATWQFQHRLTVTSPFGTVDPPSGQWYDDGDSVTVSISGSPDVQGSTRHLFEDWSGCSTASVTSVNIIMDSAKICTANWKTQHLVVTDNGGHGSVSPPSTWVDDGSFITIDISGSPEVSGSSRYIFDQWSDCSTSNATQIQIVVNGPLTCTATWSQQHQFTYTTAWGDITPASGTWVDHGWSLQVAVSGSPDVQGETRYLFAGWSDCDTSSNPTITITLNGPVHCMANWDTQYHVVIDDGMHGSILGLNDFWADPGELVAVRITGSPEVESSGTRRWVFEEWSLCASSPSMEFNITITGPTSCQALWYPEYRIRVETNQEFPLDVMVDDAVVGQTPYNIWQRSGEMLTVSLNESVEYEDINYAFDGWELRLELLPSVTLPATQAVDLFANYVPTEALLSGTVTDLDTGLPIEGATITINGIIAFETGFNGTYSIHVTAGTHSIEVSAEGYTTTIQDWTGDAGDIEEVNFRLAPEEVSEDRGTSAAVVGGIIIAILLIGAAVAVFVVLKMRNTEEPVPRPGTRRSTGLRTEIAGSVPDPTRLMDYDGQPTDVMTDVGSAQGYDQGYQQGYEQQQQQGYDQQQQQGYEQQQQQGYEQQQQQGYGAQPAPRQKANPTTICTHCSEKVFSTGQYCPYCHQALW